MDTVTYETQTIQRPFHTITCDDCEKILIKVLGDMVCRTICNSYDFSNRVMAAITSFNNNNK